MFSPICSREGKDEELTAASLAGMKISDAQVLKSATQEEVNTNNAQLLKESLSNLPEIRSQYFKTFAGMETSVASSRSFYFFFLFFSLNLVQTGLQSVPHSLNVQVLLHNTWQYNLFFK